MTHISPTGFWDNNNPDHAMSKPLSDWIIEYLKPFSSKHIYDFGCGPGMYLERLRVNGFKHLQGFEGSPPLNKVFDNIKQQDLTLPFAVDVKGIVISLEVAEHIPAKYTNTYLNNIRNACEVGGKFICSWAVRGQGGHGHCSELNNDEAIALITSKGFNYLESDSMDARKNITEERDISGGKLPWFRDTTLIFEKK